MEKVYPTFEQAEVAAEAEIKAQLNESFKRFDSLEEKCVKLGIVGIQPIYRITNSIRDKKIASMRQYAFKHFFIPGDRYELGPITWAIHTTSQCQDIVHKSLSDALTHIENKQLDN